MKIHKGDEVKIVLGKDKGKTGKVEKIMPKEDMVVVTGMNQYKRHMKARSQSQSSEIVTITKPMDVAKVRLVCPKCHTITRVGYKMEGEKKVRICRKCDQAL